MGVRAGAWGWYQIYSKEISLMAAIGSSTDNWFTRLFEQFDYNPKMKNFLSQLLFLALAACAPSKSNFSGWFPSM